jgi:hypothetical protein
VLDVLKPLGDKAVIENELEGFGIRLNKTPPNIVSPDFAPCLICVPCLVAGPDGVLSHS